MNYNKISIVGADGKTKTIRNLHDFVVYRKGNIGLIVRRGIGNNE
jgi:hypothetical protein